MNPYHVKVPTTEDKITVAEDEEYQDRLAPLLEAAALAEELIPVDELEEYARRLREGK